MQQQETKDQKDDAFSKGPKLDESCQPCQGPQGPSVFKMPASAGEHVVKREPTHETKRGYAEKPIRKAPRAVVSSPILREANTEGNNRVAQMGYPSEYGRAHHVLMPRYNQYQYGGKQTKRTRAVEVIQLVG